MQNIVYKVGSNLPETIFDKEFSDGYGTLSFESVIIFIFK